MFRIRRLAAAVGCAVILLGAFSAVGAPALAQTGRAGDFTDIEGHWAEATIEAYHTSGVIDASPDGHFNPDKPITRLDFTVWLARALELPGATPVTPPFKDWSSIPADDRADVAAAVNAGLVKGYPDHTFRPTATIARVELATLFGRSLMELGVAAEDRWFDIFGDGHTIPAWALPAAAAISTLVVRGIPSSKPKLDFAPFQTASRAQAITLIDRFLETRLQIQPNLTPTPKPAALGSGPFFSAYYVNTDYGYQTLVNHGQSLDLIVYTGYSLGADGSLSGVASPRTMAWDAQTQKPMLAMISAHSRTANNAVLSSDRAMQAAVDSIVGIMDQGFAGVNLDMENVDASLRGRYTQFVGQLAAALHPLHKVVTLSVMAKTADLPTNSLVGVFDYAGLGQIADYIMIMTYDYHWVGGPPGPIAPISWVNNVLKYAVAQMPSQKILVGIPTYAYLWPNNGKQAKSTAAWDAQNQAAAQGVTPNRVGEGEMTFTAKLADGITYTYYYNDTTAIAQKIALVGQYNLAGAIMWRLGFEADDGWADLTNAFNQVRRP